MSVRKISELPFIDCKDSSFKEYLKYSLIEISYSKYDTPGDAKWFESKSISYGDMVSSIILQIFGTEQNPGDIVDFWNIVNFHQPVYMYAGLELSGNFYVNKDFDDSALRELNFETVLRSGSNTLYAANENVLCSEALKVYANLISFSTPGDNSTNYALFDKDKTVFNTSLTAKDTTVGNLTCQDLQCTGTAYFSNLIQGCALCARWADLAEGYESDDLYDPGTFVRFGGEKEITIATKEEANAVITTKPGLILGGDDRRGTIQQIVLVGRTPVKVVGSVKKFDKLVMSDIPGVATPVRDKNSSQTIIARALETAESDDTTIHLVEAVVQLQL